MAQSPTAAASSSSTSSASAVAANGGGSQRKFGRKRSASERGTTSGERARRPSLWERISGSLRNAPSHAFADAATRAIEEQLEDVDEGERDHRRDGRERRREARGGRGENEDKPEDLRGFGGGFEKTRWEGIARRRCNEGARRRCDEGIRGGRGRGRWRRTCGEDERKGGREPGSSSVCRVRAHTQKQLSPVWFPVATSPSSFVRHACQLTLLA